MAFIAFLFGSMSLAIWAALDNPAGIVSLIIFFEVPVSAIIAGIWLKQRPSVGIIPGIIGLLIGCAIFVAKSDNK